MSKMRNHSIVYAMCMAIVVTCLCLAGCHSKKKIAEGAKTERVEKQTERTDQPTVDAESSATTIVPEEPIEEPAVVPEEPVVEPIEEPEVSAGWHPQHRTAYGRGTVTLLYKQQRLASPVVVTYIADSIVVASLQPMLGIEMYRLEALRDGARLFEKLNRRYVEMSYEEISLQTKRFITFETVEQMVEEVGLTFPIGQDTTLHYAGVEATLRLQYRTIDQAVQAMPLSEYGFTQTTLNAILSK